MRSPTVRNPGDFRHAICKLVAPTLGMLLFFAACGDAETATTGDAASPPTELVTATAPSEPGTAPTTAAAPTTATAPATAAPTAAAPTTVASTTTSTPATTAPADPGDGWDAADWIGRIAARAGSEAGWDAVVIDGVPTDLLVEIGGAVAPWSGDYSVRGVAWLVSDEPVDYRAPRQDARMMVWLGVETEPDRIEVLDVLILAITETQPFEWCFQHRDAGAAWPLVMWVGDSAWAASPPPDLFTPFDPTEIECSAG